MTDFTIDHTYAIAPRRARRPTAARGSVGRRPFSLHYAGVLVIWVGLLVIRPRLALQLFCERRADSPIPRRDI